MKFAHILMVAIVAVTSSCRMHENAATPMPSPTVQAMPRAFVYKMRADYSQYVPVALSSDRTKIVAYPDQTDIAHMPTPTALGDGWWLDNRGINGQVAFTTWTYAEYKALPATPSTKEIMDHIKDATPLVEAWLCAPRHTYGKDEVKKLNAVIKAGFPGCTKVSMSY